MIKIPLISPNMLVTVREWTRKTCVFLGSLTPELWGSDDQSSPGPLRATATILKEGRKEGT